MNGELNDRLLEYVNLIKGDYIKHNANEDEFYINFQFAVDASDAQIIIEKYTYSNQRAISNRHVALLENEMNNGRFVQGTQIRFEFNLKTNELVLVDGYHRLNAVMRTGATQIFVVLLVSVNSLQTLQHHYANIDRGKQRTVADQLLAYDTSNNLSLSNNELAHINSACNRILTGFYKSPSRHALSGLAMLRQVELVADTAKLYLELLKKATFAQGVKRKFISGTILACAIITFRYQPLKASVFWSQVLFPEKISLHDPTFFLREFLVSLHSNDTEIKGVIKSVTGGVIAPRVAITIATSWNCFMKNKKLKQVHRSYYEQDIVFDGCPSFSEIQAWILSSRP